MTDTNDKELEETMLKALNGLKELRREKEEKRDKRNWSEIEVPFTLHDGLSSFTKYELDTIRKNLGIRNASNLKKAELTELLQERIPEYLDQLYLLWDTDRFKLLTQIASRGGQIPSPNNIEADQIDYFRGNGLIYTGVFEGKKVLIIPNELIEPINALKNNFSVKKAINRNTEWIKLTRGLLYYYGTLSAEELINMIEKYTEESVNFSEFRKVIVDANSYHKEIYINEDGFSNVRVFDSKRVKQEHRTRESIDFYSFKKQQLLTAGEPDFVEKNESYRQLVRFLTDHFDMDKVEADSIVEECVFATRIGHGPNEVLHFLSETLVFDSEDIISLLMEKVIYLMNNTREWFLKGHTANELHAEEKDFFQPFPTPVSTANKNQSKKVVKIGRNEPCPCGSGKKYKKCCGR
ncbi:SEC-C metal-binding domain-containing protein [Evansella sp. AB-P1]|uniref:YecA family protein n=1 Tax=Evansella sp. AB-P1 TaxID=3037653 RepID=UPI00241E3631|nr:SEC-C metal-binding domain-containing protein [Evansella sp. AB-P1]MDG5788810.1 SEC-C metal-binding domain-containing protein [Evansella sp. AB-P1]